jgi:hypothetical protein
LDIKLQNKRDDYELNYFVDSWMNTFRNGLKCGEKFCVIVGNFGTEKLFINESNTNGKFEGYLEEFREEMRGFRAN